MRGTRELAKSIQPNVIYIVLGPYQSPLHATRFEDIAVALSLSLLIRKME